MAPNDEPFILIVEDDPDQAALIHAAFKTSLAQAKTHFVLSGWEARAYLARQSPYHDWDPVSTSGARRPRPWAAGHQRD